MGIRINSFGQGRGYRGAIPGLDNAEVRFISAGEIAHLLRSGEAHIGVTGVLCAYEDGNGFLQALEGGRAEVNALYNKIVCDDRHTDVVLLAYEEIDERRFANWRMGRIDLSRVNPSVLLRYCEHPRLDPTSLTARAAMAANPSPRSCVCLRTVGSGSNTAPTSPHFAASRALPRAPISLRFEAFCPKV